MSVRHGLLSRLGRNRPQRRAQSEDSVAVNNQNLNYETRDIPPRDGDDTSSIRTILPPYTPRSPSPAPTYRTVDISSGTIDREPCDCPTQDSKSLKLPCDKLEHTNLPSGNYTAQRVEADATVNGAKRVATLQAAARAGH